MPNDAFRQYVINRIDEILSSDPKCKQLQTDSVAAESVGDVESMQEINCEYEARAEELCYIAGFKDAIALLSNK